MTVTQIQNKLKSLRVDRDAVVEAKADGFEAEAVRLSGSINAYEAMLDEAITAIDAKDAESSKETPKFSFKDLGVNKEIVAVGAVGAGFGAELVGEEWAANYEVARIKGNPLGAKVKRVRTASTHNIPVMTAAGTAAITAENTAYNASDPTISTVTLGAYKYTQKVPVSEELLADALYNVDGLLAENFGLAFGKAEFDAIVNGSGLDAPTGVMSKTKNVDLAAKSSVTVDDLINIMFTVDEMYRANCTWVMADATLKAVAKLKNLDGDLIWTAPREGMPGMILGFPYMTSAQCAALGTAGNKAVLFFDPEQVIVGDRGPLSVKKLVLSEYGTTYAASQRFDVKLAPVSAFAVAACGALDA